jgi:hypothetical protein
MVAIRRRIEWPLSEHLASRDGHPTRPITVSCPPRNAQGVPHEPMRGDRSPLPLASYGK